MIQNFENLEVKKITTKIFKKWLFDLKFKNKENKIIEILKILTKKIKT